MLSPKRTKFRKMQKGNNRGLATAGSDCSFGDFGLQAIEPARQAKKIGNSLEAEVALEIADEALLAALRGREAELEEFFLVSSLHLSAGPETRAALQSSEAKKCARCWRHLRTVGLSVAHPDLCDRCTEAVSP